MEKQNVNRMMKKVWKFFKLNLKFVYISLSQITHVKTQTLTYSLLHTLSLTHTLSLYISFSQTHTIPLYHIHKLCRSHTHTLSHTADMYTLSHTFTPTHIQKINNKKMFASVMVRVVILFRVNGLNSLISLRWCLSLFWINFLGALLLL